MRHRRTAEAGDPGDPGETDAIRGAYDIRIRDLNGRHPPYMKQPDGGAPSRGTE
jgi:hypothetical protein